MFEPFWFMSTLIFVIGACIYAVKTYFRPDVKMVAVALLYTILSMGTGSVMLVLYIQDVTETCRK